jgi:hypothetical protein
MARVTKLGGFLVVFTEAQVADRVLHAPPPPGAEFPLLFRQRQRQHSALFAQLRYMVLLSMMNVPTHVWSLEFVQAVVGTSCLVVEASPASLDRSDLSIFFVVGWSAHPDLIPVEVGCIVPEPEEDVIGQQPLFL